MPRNTLFLELLETRSLLAGDDSSQVCPIAEIERLVPSSPQCPGSEVENVSGEDALRPSGTSRIDHYPESKGWWGDLWDHMLSMVGWK